MSTPIDHDGSEFSSLPCETVVLTPRGKADRLDHSDRNPELTAATRKVEVVIDREAIAELRASDPATSAWLDAVLRELPAPGDEFEGFTLLSELGHGAFGRVFLARQRALADRPVALKIAADLHGEAHHLAQLQHTNIVPIYSNHQSGKLHAVCMPYFGSTTLADVCRSLSTNPSLPTSGKLLISTLHQRYSTHPSFSNGSLSSSRQGEALRAADAPADQPALVGATGSLTRIEGMSYVDAVLWMALRLAGGLAHAHERGIIHRDLKPANVLVCDDGEPMLLDFNLAENVNAKGAFAIAQMGGTPPFMSPEQLIAYRDGAGAVDGRSDIYSLGLIIYQLLTGRHAFPIRRGVSRDILPKMIADRAGPPPPLRQYNRAVTPAMESLVQHCLEPGPSKRYRTAADLVEDLERQRDNLPLRHAAEPSLAERAQKWARRHPRLASPASASALAAAIMLTGVSIAVQQSLERKAHEQSVALEERRERALNHYHEFHSEYQAAQDLLTADEPVEIKNGLRHAETALRDYGVIDQADWLEQPAVMELKPSDRDRLRAEVGEIAFLMARAIHFRPHADAGQGLSLNQLAERHLDDNARPALAQQRVALKGPQVDPADELRLRQLLENAAGLNAPGRFLLACEHAAQCRHQEALRLVDSVVADDPSNFGAWFLKARCHQLLDQDGDAFAAFSTAIALRPNYARSFLCRASVLFNQQTRAREALQDLNQALKLQPDLLDAHIDRSLVLLALGECKQALLDLDWALEREGVPTRIWFLRSNVHMRLDHPVEAKKDHERGLQLEPADHLSWVARGNAKLPFDADAALADFIKAEEAYPRCVEALNNQAFVYAVKLKRPADAIAALDRLLTHFPSNPRALAYRAILLARTGQTEKAIAEARKAANLPLAAEHHYRAACALAIASENAPAVKDESLRLLGRAVLHGWAHQVIETDRDLTAVRDTPEYKQLVLLARLMRACKPAEGTHAK
jgi:eukaryotic-like serine/threonine-protein kinase